MCGCVGVKEDCCKGIQFFKVRLLLPMLFHELVLLLETQTLLHFEGNSLESRLSTVLIECVCLMM
jgi:hypothetical protein